VFSRAASPACRNRIAGRGGSEPADGVERAIRGGLTDHATSARASTASIEQDFTAVNMHHTWFRTGWCHSPHGPSAHIFSRKNCASNVHFDPSLMRLFTVILSCVIQCPPQTSVIHIA
jgi:hypothetical protein